MNNDIVIVAEAEATALTTLERVKLELSISNDTSDELLLAKIAGASSVVAGLCFPSLKRETVIETFYPDCYWECADRLTLDRNPVVSISSVTVDGTALTDVVIVDDVVTDLAEWRLDGERRRLRRQTTAGKHSHWSFCTSIDVAYTGGYLLPGETGRNLPVEIEEACIELVTAYWMTRGRDPGLRAEENVGVFRFEYETKANGYEYGLPPGVMAKLDKYLRKEMVL